MRRRDFISGLLKLGVGLAVADKLAFIEGLGRSYPVAPHGIPKDLTWYVDKEFLVGFEISKQIVEDDLYGKVELISNALYDPLTKKFAYYKKCISNSRNPDNQ
jgi:hypothetical protein